jgi:uncharacterized protein with ParB-like and HNH nuclease domain
MDLQHNLYDIYDIFQKNGILVIPKYQRGYAWSDENFAELWDDIRVHIIENNEAHFFGSLIFADRPSAGGRKYSEVIDGQQRLTTFSIFFRAMYDICPEKNGIRTQIYRKIFSDDEGQTYRLTLGDVDEKFFSTFIKQPAPARSRTGKLTSHKNIRKCYEYFIKSLEAYISESGQDVNVLINTLFERFETQTQFLLLKVPSDSDAYVIFESINAKRVDLTPAELLKNYFFSTSDREGSAALGLVQDKWSTINDNLEQYAFSPEVTTYIRHYWISNNEDTQEKNLYKTIKNGTKSNYGEIENLISGLATYSSDYALLHNISTSKSTNGLNLSSFNDINKLGYRQAHPLMLSLLSSSVTQDDFDELMSLLTSVFVRRSITKSNPNELEKVLSVSARAVRSNIQDGIKNLISDLERLNPDDESVIKSMTSRGDASIPRFILEAYEISLAAKGGKVIDKPTLEHIMPQKPESFSDWGMNEDEHTDWVQSIGNLTLLEQPINSSIKNKKFSIKRAEYEKQATDMNLTKEIVTTFKEWSLASIQARADKLSRFAIKNWPKK